MLSSVGWRAVDDDDELGMSPVHFIHRAHGLAERCKAEHVRCLAAAAALDRAWQSGRLGRWAEGRRNARAATAAAFATAAAASADRPEGEDDLASQVAVAIEAASPVVVNWDAFGYQEGVRVAKARKSEVLADALEVWQTETKGFGNRKPRGHLSQAHS